MSEERLEASLINLSETITGELEEMKTFIAAEVAKASEGKISQDELNLLQERLADRIDQAADAVEDMIKEPESLEEGDLDDEPEPEEPIDTGFTTEPVSESVSEPRDLSTERFTPFNR